MSTDEHRRYLMWIMFTGGVLMPAVRPPHTVAEGDDRTMQVRSRVRLHIDRFRADYCPSLSETLASPGMDYQYRAYCTMAELQVAMAMLADRVDYAHFKHLTEDDYGDHALHSTYLGVWSLLHRDFPDARPDDDADLARVSANRLPRTAETAPGFDIVSRPLSARERLGLTGPVGDSRPKRPVARAVSTFPAAQTLGSWAPAPKFPTAYRDDEDAADDVAAAAALGEGGDDVESTAFDLLADDNLADDEWLDMAAEDEFNSPGESVLAEYATEIRAAIIVARARTVERAAAAHG